MVKIRKRIMFERDRDACIILLFFKSYLMKFFFEIWKYVYVHSARVEKLKGQRKVNFFDTAEFSSLNEIFLFLLWVYAAFSWSMTSLVGNGFFSHVSACFNECLLKCSIPLISSCWDFSCWIATKISKWNFVIKMS